MSIQILSAVWGEKHIELFRRATLRSLSQQRNRAALCESGSTIWNIFSEPKYFDTLKVAIAAKMPEVTVELRSIESLRDRTDNLLSATIWQIERCLNENAKMLLAPPDTVFGDGTVPSLISIGKDPDSCVVVPHPRVLPAVLDEEFSTNAELVSKAWDHLHRSWSEAEDGHKRQNSFIGGVSWRRITPTIFSVTHRLPTVYFANFTKEDLLYFQSKVGYGSWDHEWPGDVLLPRQRQRYVGSSDAAFICEITDKEKNIPPVVRGGEPDKFWKNHLHNQVNRGISMIFRADDEKPESLIAP